MPLQYTNSKKQTYYLHVGKTKKGNPRYYFSMKSEGQLADSIPQGYEIYENPNSQVFLRKIKSKQIFDGEVALVEFVIENHSDLRHYKIGITKNLIQIFTPDQEIDELTQIFLPLTPVGFNENSILRLMTYSPVMQFVLVDKEKRLFITKRYCFLGSVDDWIQISDEDTLENLTRRYIKHIGKDSYYELFYPDLPV